jgi:phosphoesterase RecJ-like protein
MTPSKGNRGVGPLLDNIAEIILKSDEIAILPHVAADGDALGSSFALALALSRLGKKAAVFLEEELPFIYGFLPGSNMSEVFDGLKTKYGTVIAVDCGDKERLGARKELFDNAEVTANIDHHPTNTSFADHNHVNPDASATAEIIRRLLELLGIEPDREIATGLYVGIATDTGSFRYSNTTSETHRIVSELIKAGVDVAEVSEKIFDSVSCEKVKLTGEAINSLELFENGRIAIMTLTIDQIRKTGARDEDSDGIINTARSIRGVSVAAMLRQSENGDIKVNLRSNALVDVSGIARLHSGGGHKKAAGYTTGGSLEMAKHKLLEEIRKAL